MDISVLRKERRLYANQDEIDKLKPVQVKKVPPAPQGSAMKWNTMTQSLCRWL